MVAAQTSFFDLLDSRPAQPEMVDALYLQTPEQKASLKPRKRKPSRAPAISDEIRTEHQYLVKHKHEWRLALRKSGIRGESAYVVGLYLCDERAGNKTGKLYPKVETMAADIGMPVGTVKGAIAALKKAGLLYAKKPRFNGPPDYFLALPSKARKADNPSDRGSNEQLVAKPTDGRDFIRRTVGRASDSTMEDNHGRIKLGT